jgi:hypothetical protein
MKKVVLYEPGSRKAVLLTRQYKELFRSFGICLKIIAGTVFGFDSAVRRYRSGIKKITNQSSWEEYLNR